MAYFLEKDDLENDPNAGDPTGLPDATGGVTGGVLPVQAGGGNGSPLPAAEGSGRFVNFDRVLNANRDNATAMSNRVADKVDAQAGKAQDMVAGSVADFQRESLYQSPSYVPTTTQNANGYYDPNVATYGGPKKLSDVAPAGLTGTYDAANESLNNLKNPYGVQALIGQDVQGHYSEGMSNLDGALAGATGGKKFNDLSAKYAGLGSAMTQANAAVDASLKAAEDRTKKVNTESEAMAKAQNKKVDDDEEQRLLKNYSYATGTDYRGTTGWNERVNNAATELDAFYARTGRTPSDKYRHRE